MPTLIALLHLLEYLIAGMALAIALALVLAGNLPLALAWLAIALLFWASRTRPESHWKFFQWAKWAAIALLFVVG